MLHVPYNCGSDSNRVVPKISFLNLLEQYTVLEQIHPVHCTPLGQVWHVSLLCLTQPWEW